MLEQRKKYRKGKPFSAVTLQKIDKHATNVEPVRNSIMHTFSTVIQKLFYIMATLLLLALQLYSKVPNKRTCTSTYMYKSHI